MSCVEGKRARAPPAAQPLRSSVPGCVCVWPQMEVIVQLPCNLDVAGNCNATELAYVEVRNRSACRKACRACAAP